MVQTTPLPVHVAATITAAMTERGISTRQMAELTNQFVSRSTLLRKLHGEGYFDVRELAHIAPHIGTTPSRILAAAESRAA